jgi:nucleoside-diphosphate-sugar epimerase
MKMKKDILITGATGLVGSHLLLYLLEKGYKPLALYRNEKSIDKVQNLFRLYSKTHLLDAIQWIKADIRDDFKMEEIVKEADVIFHAAAKISFAPKDKKELYETNVFATEKLVNLALEHRVSYFLYVSSVAALGGNEPLKSEKSVWSWNISHTHYGATKFLAEMEVWRGFQEGLNGSIINPSVIIGPGFWFSSFGNVVRRLAENKMPFYTTGMTGYVDVRDVVEIMYRLYIEQKTGERFVVNAGNRTFDDILFKLAGFLDVPPPKYKIQKGVLEFLKYPVNLISVLSGKGKILDKASIDALYDHTGYDNTKIVKELDYKFIPVDESLKHTARMYKQHRR